MPNTLTLHELHVSAGAVVEEACGWLLPVHYGDPAAEHRAVRAAAGLVDRSLVGKVEVTGRDRVSFLQGMLTNDLKALTPGQACPAAFLDAHGKVQALLTVLALEDRLLLELPPGMTEKTLQTLDKFLISEKVEFTDVTEAFALFALHGPKAAAVLADASGSPLELEPYRHAERTVVNASARVCRVDELGVPGYHVWVACELAAEVWRRLLQTGRPHGLRPVGGSALTVLRVEAGVPCFGHDVDDSTLLMEAPLEHLVSYTKGCYIGQEIVARIKYRGHVNRLLTGITLDSTEVPDHGAAVFAEGGEIGRVTSAVYSLTLGRPIALAYLRREHLEPGTPVMVRHHEGTVPARVTALPFVPSA
ncbi:MAG: aminomethyl transferase family protein [Candidatus Rokubacteria bacterium]|nr:aminomethyl transferase family protein [Candidatus Rokubacteria bacterium]